MNKTLASLLLFVASAIGKARGGGGGGSIDDGWDAPGNLKAYFAFLIIWAIVALVQLIYILKNLSAIPSMAARGPYILLAFVTICVMLYYLLNALDYRLDILDDIAENSLYTAVTFFWSVDAPFRPMVVLYLLHGRGDILRAVKARTMIPLSTYLWKRILDWVLTALAWVMYIAEIGVTATRLDDIYGAYYYPRQSAALLRAGVGLGNTGLALTLLLYINLIVSTIVQFVQGKGTSGDLVTSRLLKVIVPLFVLYTIEVLAFNIYSQVTTFELDGLYTFDLVNVIIDGGLTAAITSALILTMTIPGVHWTPETAVPGGIPPGPKTQWAGWGQPFPPSTGFVQPVYHPQHQSQFYPAPHPLIQQMQQPYSQPTPNQGFQYSPPTQPPPMQPTQH